KGAFLPDRASGFRHLGNGVYEMVGAVADVQASLRSLRFDAAERGNDAAGSLDTATLTLTVRDIEGAQAQPATVEVVSRAANRAPSDIALSGTVAGELAAAGAVVGTLAVTDSNAGESFAYEL